MSSYRDNRYFVKALTSWVYGAVEGATVEYQRSISYGGSVTPGVSGAAYSAIVSLGINFEYTATATEGASYPVRLGCWGRIIQRAFVNVYQVEVEHFVYGPSNSLPGSGPISPNGDLIDHYFTYHTVREVLDTYYDYEETATPPV